MNTFAGKVTKQPAAVQYRRSAGVDCGSNFRPESSSELCNRRTNSFSPKKSAPMLFLT